MTATRVQRGSSMAEPIVSTRHKVVCLLTLPYNFRSKVVMLREGDSGPTRTTGTIVTDVLNRVAELLPPAPRPLLSVAQLACLGFPLSRSALLFFDTQVKDKVSLIRSLSPRRHKDVHPFAFVVPQDDDCAWRTDDDLPRRLKQSRSSSASEHEQRARKSKTRQQTTTQQGSETQRFLRMTMLQGSSLRLLSIVMTMPIRTALSQARPFSSAAACVFV